MSETARTEDVEVTAVDVADAARPPLAVVGAAPDAGAEDGPNPGRCGAIGYAVGFLVVCVAVTVIGTIGGLGFGPALGIGAFVGLWGGGGFGFMLGATVPLALHLDHQHPPPPRSSR